VPEPQADTPVAGSSRAATTRRRGRRLAAFGRPIRAAWLFLGATLLALVAVELALRAVFLVKDRVVGVATIDPRLVAEGYGGATWAATHFREYQNLVADWHPYVNYRERPFTGETITVLPGGLRRTWNAPQRPGAHPLKIWVLGGSSAWGVGARDDHTIPSELARELTRRGLDVEVTNHAEIGYVLTQELFWLLLRLRAGERPDLVIYFDGANECLSALQNGVAGWPQNEAKRQQAFEDARNPARLGVAWLRLLVTESALWRLARSIGGRLARRTAAFTPEPFWRAPRSDPSALADDVLGTYEATRRLAEAQGREHGFESRFYWQPMIFTKRRPTDFEGDEVRKYAVLEPLFRAVYERMRQRVERGEAPADFRDLSGLFDDDPRTLFTDFCHTTETANVSIARAIADDIEGWLRERVAAPGISRR
jgi:hypothetical protein